MSDECVSVSVGFESVFSGCRGDDVGMLPLQGSLQDEQEQQAGAKA